MKNKIENYLGCEINDEIIEKLKNDEIDAFEIFIQLTDDQIRDYGIEILDGNNMKNELESIIIFLNQADTRLNDNIKLRLIEQKVSLSKFLSMNSTELKDLGFLNGAIIKINNLKNEKKSEEDENETEDLGMDKLFKLKKFLRPVQSQSNEFGELDPDFSKIILNDLSEEVLVNALNPKNSAASILKPYLFDYLKRHKKFKNIIKQLYSKIDLYPAHKQALEVINERDLVCCLIESVNEASLPRLGYMIAKNDYPLPLTYQVYSEERSMWSRQAAAKLTYKLNFSLFYDLLCLTSRSLAIVTGTQATSRCGKTSLIRFMFPRLNQFSTYETRINMPIVSNVDVLCNDETSEDWIIADFNGIFSAMDDNYTVNLNVFKSLSAFSSLHILNAKLADFGPSQTAPSEEIRSILSWYQRLGNQAHVVVVLRDHKKEKISDQLISNLRQLYSNVDVITVDHLFNKNADYIKLSSVREAFIKTFKEKVLEKINKRPVHSVFDVKRFYESLSQDENFASTRIIENRVEQRFREIFQTLNQNKIENLKSMFELSSICKAIEQQQLKLDKLYCSHQGVDLNQIREIEQQLAVLKNKKKLINPRNKFLDFFIDLFQDSQENHYINLLIFEKCLLNYKRHDLKELKRLRANTTSELDAILKHEKKDERRVDELKANLNGLDEQINILDLTLDKFWDEIFLYFDYLEENKKQDACKNLLISSYIDILSKGFSVHILRSNPLHVKSNLLETILNKITKYKNIYIISVIGEQSSAKSSLLNSLFGCDFRTSAGRCTVGVYLNFVQYGDRTIAILDTEGLASIENSNGLFDNQMATMAVFSSHMIILNHKGEISKNLENILGITFFAKVNLIKQSFKPFVLFVLRDQIERAKWTSGSSGDGGLNPVSEQARKLKDRLEQRSKFVRASLNDAINIDTENVKLLPNAFSEETCSVLTKKVKWRNDLFPDDVLELRQSLARLLDSIDPARELVADSPADLFIKLCSHWETIKQAGDNILNCKDLEEIKIRNEISFKANELIEKHRLEFSKQLDNLLNDELKKLETSYNEQIKIYCEHQIVYLYTEMLKQVVDDYNSKTNVSFYPQCIKDEYRNRIKYQFDWIRDINKARLYEASLRLKNMSSFNETNTSLINRINVLLRERVDKESFEKMVRQSCEQIDTENMKKFDELLTPLDQLILNAQVNYNQNIQILMRSNENLRALANITDLKEFYLCYVNSTEIPEINIEVNLLKKGHTSLIGKIINKVGSAFSSTNREVINTSDIALELFLKYIDPNFPTINSNQITSTLVNELIYLIYEKLFNRLSQAFDQRVTFQIFSPLMKLALCKMVYQIDQVQSLNQNFQIAKYRKFKDDLINEALRTFVIKQNSRSIGENSSVSFLDYFFDVYTDKLITQSADLNNKYVQNAFKSPTDLVNFAYKSSFEISDYEKIYKYVIDINRYCLEVCITSVKPQIELNIRDASIIFTINFGKVKQALLELSVDVEEKVKTNIYEIIDELIRKLKSSTEFNNKEAIELEDVIKVVKGKTINVDVEDKKLFLEGFKAGLSSQDKEFEVRTKRFLEGEFSEAVKEQVKSYIEIFLGCNSTCPGCGSKCQNAKGHDGNHSCNMHILDGFNNWREIRTLKVVTRFCWEKYKMMDMKVYLKNETVVYDNFKKYLEQEHKNWLYDVEENYKNMIQIESNAQNLKLKREVIRGWMNVRKAIMNDRVDKEYDSEWLELEDKEKMLKADHKPTWNDKL